MVESLYCATEMNVALYVNYTVIKKNNKCCDISEDKVKIPISNVHKNE